MDLFAIIERELPVIYGAPVISGALVVIGAICAWWLRGRNASGEIYGLKAQILARDSADEIAGLKAQLVARDERLQLAQDQVTIQKSSMDDAFAKIMELYTQQKSAASPDEIAITTSTLSSDLSRAASANTAIGKLLTASASLPREGVFVAKPSVPEPEQKQ